MSYVTTLTFVLDFGEDEDDAGIHLLFPYFDRLELQRPVLVNDVWKWHKAMQQDVYVAAYNYFDMAPFLEWFNSIPWTGRVTLVAKEEDNKTQIYTAFGRYGQ